MHYIDIASHKKMKQNKIKNIPGGCSLMIKALISRSDENKSILETNQNQKVWL